MRSILDSHMLVDGARIAYTDSGGEDVPVVLIHGTPAHAYIWRHVRPGLVDAGHRVVVFDLLGYGLSEMPVEADTSVAAQARILGRLLDKLGVGRVHVVGHDIGGAIAMIFAIGEPERVERLALIDTVSYDS